MGEISSLHKLILIDLSMNKVSDLEKIRQTLGHLKNLKVLSLVGNTVANSKDYK